MSTLLAGEIGRLNAATAVTGATDKIPVYQDGILKYATPDQIALGQDAVVGPASSTDNAIVRFDGTTGELVQNSVVLIADTTGNVTGMGTLACAAITQTGAGANTFNSTSLDADFTVKKLTSGNAINFDAGTVALTLDATTVGITGAVTLTGDVAIAGAASELSIAKTTNQLVLGTTATVTLNSVAPAASRVVTIPDGGASGSAVIGGGNAAVALTGTGGTSTGTMTTLSAQVTSDAITTAGGATHVATITYTGIAATDIVFITKAGGTNSNTENYSYKAVCTTNTITVTLSNNTAATSLNGTVIFNILVVKV